MKVKIARGEDANPNIEGAVVVIDVLRAFTTAAVAFAMGAEAIEPVSSAAEAREIKKSVPDAFLMGEVEGKGMKGFDHDNSPAELDGRPLLGRYVVQRTSRGTQGLLAAARNQAGQILAASFLVAEATVERLKATSPEMVTLLITSAESGDEDHALAEYLKARLKGEEVYPAPFLQRVIDAAKFHTFGESGAEDVMAAIQLDRFPFAMELSMEDQHLLLRPVCRDGVPWNSLAALSHC